MEIDFLKSLIESFSLKTFILYYALCNLFYLSAYKVISNNYTIKKNFSLKGAINIAIPPDVEVENEELLINSDAFEKFKGLVDEFTGVILKKVSKEDLAIMKHNFSTLKIKKANLCGNKFVFRRNVKGVYYVEDNEISLRDKIDNVVLFHELMHSITSYNADENYLYSGFSQRNIKTKETIGVALNEGYTQYLVEKFFDIELEKNRGIYSFEKNIAELLEILIGTDMQSYYFQANLHGLVESLERYISKKEIEEFIQAFDFFSKNHHKNLINIKSKKLLEYALNIINSFLLKTFMQKQRMNSQDGSLIGEFEILLRKIPIVVFGPSCNFRTDIEALAEDNVFQPMQNKVM